MYKQYLYQLIGHTTTSNHLLAHFCLPTAFHIPLILDPGLDKGVTSAQLGTYTTKNKTECWAQTWKLPVGGEEVDTYYAVTRH